LLAHGRWFSAGSPTSSTTKTGRHDIAEILLKVALNTKDHSINRFTDHDYHFVIFKLSYYYLLSMKVNIFMRWLTLRKFENNCPVAVVF
jgi:hypothetical protein